MISRAALARSVCLRCQVRSLNRPKAHSSLRIPPFRSEQLQRRQYSAQSAWDRLETDSRLQENSFLKKRGPVQNSSSVQEESPQEQPEPQSSHAANVEQDGSSQSTNEPESAAAFEYAPTRRGRNLFRTFTRRDERDYKRIRNSSVYLQRQNLDANMLGVQGRTIVMREEKRQKKVRPMPVQKPILPKPFDVNAALMAEEKELEIEDALSNIHELCPSDPVVLQRDFDAMVKVLVDGFTAAQLKEYYIRAISAHAKELRGKQAEDQYKWVRRHWPWSPARTLEITGLPKQRQVMTIMKECWNLKIREIVDGPGNSSVVVQEGLLALLARDEQRLNSIREGYLDAGETIVVDTMQSRISIAATKAKTDTIMKKLDEAYRDMNSGTLRAKWIPSSAFDGALLEHLGRVTNTSIGFDRTSKTIRVSWFTSGSSSGSNERMLDVVERLLYTAFHPRYASTTLKYKVEDVSGRLVPEVRGREKLSWKDKLTRWSRWVMPANRISPPKTPTSLSVPDVLPRPLQAPRQDSQELWSKPYNTTTASFGHILHKDDGDFSLATAAKDQSYIFSPTSPPPVDLAALNTLTASEPLKTSLILTFRPHPSLEKNTTENLPGLLELHITVPDDLPEGPLSWNACSKRLVAVLEQHHTDVAQPSEPVDLRLSQPLLSNMSPSALDNSPFRQYIEAAELDLLAGQLDVPSEITLSDLPSANGEKLVSEPAKYRFVGLEMRRTLEIEYEGHKLQYTSIQAGQHGGQRAELVLEATPANASTPQQDYAKRYLDLVQELALGGVVKWVGERDRQLEMTVPEPVFSDAETISQSEAGVDEHLGPAEQREAGTVAAAGREKVEQLTGEEPIMALDEMMSFLNGELDGEERVNSQQQEAKTAAADESKDKSSNAGEDTWPKNSGL